MSSEQRRQVPMVDYLVLGSDDRPHLVANRCRTCSALFFDRRNACGRCGERKFEQTEVASTGTLRAFTIVYRAAPNVPAPYISAVVDLDGGGSIKADLLGTPVEPKAVPLGGSVELMTYVAGTDDEGTEAVAFGFRPVVQAGNETRNGAQL